ncbi:unnamed protein product [Closterium sp. NIES-53]
MALLLQPPEVFAGTVQATTLAPSDSDLEAGLLSSATRTHPWPTVFSLRNVSLSQSRPARVAAARGTRSSRLKSRSTRPLAQTVKPHPRSPRLPSLPQFPPPRPPPVRRKQKARMAAQDPPQSAVAGPLRCFRPLSAIERSPRIRLPPDLRLETPPPTLARGASDVTADSFRLLGKPRQRRGTHQPARQGRGGSQGQAELRRRAAGSVVAPAEATTTSREQGVGGAGRGSMRRPLGSPEFPTRVNRVNQVNGKQGSFGSKGRVGRRRNAEEGEEEGRDRGLLWKLLSKCSVEKCLELTHLARFLCLLMWAAVTVAVAFVVFWVTYRSFQAARQAEVEQECDKWTSLLESHFSQSADQVRLLGAVVSTFFFQTPNATLDQPTFSSLVNATDYARPLLFAASFALRVTLAERPAFEKQQQQLGNSGYCIRHGSVCAGSQPEYAPIVLTSASASMIGQGLLGRSYRLDQPLTGVDSVDLPDDQLAFQEFLAWGECGGWVRGGFADRPGTIEAVTRARDDGVLGALAPPFRLNLSLSSNTRPISHGLFIVFPVYRTPDPLPDGSSSSEYRAACLGYMTAIVDFEPMWDAMLAVRSGGGGERGMHGEGCWVVRGAGW